MGEKHENVAQTSLPRSLPSNETRLLEIYITDVLLG